MKARMAMRAATATTGMMSSTAGRGCQSVVHHRWRQEDRGHAQEHRQVVAPARRPVVQVAVGFDRQPQGAVDYEQQDKQDAPGQAVGVEQGKEVPLKDALGVDGDAFEQVGKGTEQQGRRKLPRNRPRPGAIAVVHFAKYHRHARSGEDEHRAE
jgi:hypothetical protein